MERPKGINSGEAMLWNADVERRRIAHHQKRCAEDPIYKRVYERQQEMMQRIQLKINRDMAQVMNAMNSDENTKCQQLSDQTNVGNEQQVIKSHDEAMRERRILIENAASRGRLAKFGLGFILSAVGFADYERMKQLNEEQPYAEEIRKADAEFDKEIIRMSGFEW